MHFLKYGFKEGRYSDEIKKVMPEILKRHPECKSDLNGGLLRIRITNACNAKCRYCGVRLTFGEEANHAMESSWYYELCKPLYEKLGMIMITGGDAFFAKESYNYMKFMSENFPKITLMTESNGIAFNEKFQQLACKNLFKTHFSINASNAETFAKSTARKMYPFIIRNIKNYIHKLELEDKLCFAPDLSMVINKDNVDDIENFVELALNLHAGFVVFFFDYTENDMNSEYFSNPETSRPALKTLMELERVLAEKFIIYFRLWLPTAEAAAIQQEVEATPIDDLNRKYEKILKLAEGRNPFEELRQRNKFRRECGKRELGLIDDVSAPLHLIKVEDRDICFAPWNELDIRPDGQIDFCCWFQSTININNFIRVKDGKEFVDWEEISDSYEYVAARYRILRGDYEGCQVCCPLNPIKNPVEAATKYNLDRLD